MVREHLDVRLDQIAGGETYTDLVIGLIAWAERTDRVIDLLEGAGNANGGNEAVKTLLKDAQGWPQVVNAPASNSQAARTKLWAHRWLWFSIAVIAPTVGGIYVLQSASQLEAQQASRSAVGLVYCNGTNNSMVFVESGTYLRGSTPEQINQIAASCPKDNSACPNYFWDEQPQVEVFVDDYCIDIHEVTVEEFADFVQSQGYTTTAEMNGFSEVWDDSAKKVVPNVVGASWRFPDGPGAAPSVHDHPVTQVSWYDANAFCTSHGKRLPTSDEWEKSARGTQGIMYPWGDTWNQAFLNFADTYPRGIKPVGQYPEGVSPYGLMDTLGNSIEWVDGTKPGDASLKERRGGGWASSKVYVHAAWRAYRAPDIPSPITGFRCAKDASSQSVF